MTLPNENMKEINLMDNSIEDLEKMHKLEKQKELEKLNLSSNKLLNLKYF